MALSGLALTPAPAQAIDFSITFGTGHPPIVRHHHVDPRPVKPSPRVAPRHAPPPARCSTSAASATTTIAAGVITAAGAIVAGVIAAGATGATLRAIVTVVTQRYWDGRHWVTDRRRVCRR